MATASSKKKVATGDWVDEPGPQAAPTPAPAPSPASAPAPARGAGGQWEEEGAPETEFERQNKSKPYYGFGVRNLLRNVGQGLWNVAKTPYEIAEAAAMPAQPGEVDLSSIMPGAMLAKRLLVDPAAEEFGKAAEAARMGRYVEMGGHALAGAIPLEGPWIAGFAEQAGQGDIGGALARGATEYLGYTKGAQALGQVPAAMESRRIRKATQEIKQVAKFPAKALDAPESVRRSLPYLAREARAQPLSRGPGAVREAADAAKRAADHVWEDTVRPQIARHGTATLDGNAVADGALDNISTYSKDIHPEELAAAQDLADRFRGQIPLVSAAEYVKGLNAEVDYARTPEARASGRVTGAGTAVLEGLADGLRGAMLDRLGDLGETGAGEARLDYGALRQVHEALRNQANAAERGIRPTVNIYAGIIPRLQDISGAAFGAVRSRLYGGAPEPGPTAARAFRRLARTGLEPPEYPAPTIRPPFGLLPPAPASLGPVPPGPSEVRGVPAAPGEGGLPTGARMLPPAPEFTPQYGYSVPTPGEVAERTPHGVPAQREVQRGPGGRMQRVYTGETPPESFSPQPGTKSYGSYKPRSRPKR